MASDEAAVGRVSGRFVPGVSGNPAGRPPAERDLPTVAAEARKRVTEILVLVLGAAIEAPAGAVMEAAPELMAVIRAMEQASDALSRLLDGAIAQIEGMGAAGSAPGEPGV